MALIGRREGIAIAAAAAVTVLMPLMLVLPGGGDMATTKEAPVAPLAAPQAPPTLAVAYERPLFGAPAADTGETAADAPELVGVVGRLGADAVALVRTADGTTRTLRIGESVDGWRLGSLAIDAAFFTRGAQQARVPLPAGE